MVVESSTRHSRLIAPNVTTHTYRPDAAPTDNEQTEPSKQMVNQAIKLGSPLFPIHDRTSMSPKAIPLPWLTERYPCVILHLVHDYTITLLSARKNALLYHHTRSIYRLHISNTATSHVCLFQTTLIHQRAKPPRYRQTGRNKSSGIFRKILEPKIPQFPIKETTHPSRLTL